MLILDETMLQPLLEALLLAAGKPLREEDLLALFLEEERPSKELLRQCLKNLQESCDGRGIRLVEIASGYQFQINVEWSPWVARLWEEKAPRYSRALMETLALIAYRQPLTRGEIEDIRGVSISQSIFKTLLEDREWIRIVGHREVPGKPALYATTKLFLDYFGLKTLDELPSLPEVMNLDNGNLMEDDRIEKLMQNALGNPSADSDSETDQNEEFEVNESDNISIPAMKISDNATDATDEKTRIFLDRDEDFEDDAEMKSLESFNVELENVK